MKFSILKVTMIGALSVCTSAQYSLANDESSAPLEATKPPAPTNYKISASWWNALSLRTPTESQLNPDNRVLNLSTQLFSSDLRPELKVTPENFSLVARPKFVVDSTYAKVANQAPANQTTASGKWSELYWQWNPSEKIQLTHGLQSFQWGPAESGSPSNRLFHDSIQGRDLLFDLKGQHLIRINFTPYKDWSEIFIFMPGDNGDSEFEFGEAFSQKALLKSERSWNNGAEYFGLVLGWRDRFGVNFGSYWNVQLSEGLSFYCDSNHQRGSLGWYPDADPSTGLITLSQSRRSLDRIFSSITSGLRYSFENGNDLRAEFVFHENGYTKTDENLLWQSITSTQLFQLALRVRNWQIAQQNGLEFNGQKFGHFSLRIPDIFHRRDFIFYMRALFSLTDTSFTVYNTWEYSVGESGTAFAGIQGNSGDPDSELRGLITNNFTIGYRHAW